MSERISEFRDEIRMKLQKNHFNIESEPRMIGVNRMIERLVARGYEVMLFHQGLGETCMFAMLMHA